MQHDVLGRIVKTYAPEWTSGTAHTTSYTYDTLSRLTAKTSSDAGTVQYKYDKAGNVRFSQDAVQAAAGKVLFTTYDFANRPLRTGVAAETFSTLDPNVVHAFENSTATWQRLDRYDVPPLWDDYPWYYFQSPAQVDLENKQGRLLATVEKSNGVWQLTAYIYDTRGRVADKFVRTQNATAFNTSHNYTYDRQDNLTLTVTFVGTHNFNYWYDYDAVGRLWKVFTATTSTKPASPDVTYTYTPAGRISQEAYLGGTTIPVKYTIRDWVDTFDNLATPSKSFAAKYLYFANGNVQESHFRQLSSPAANKQYRYVFTYDAANRLTAADHWTYTTAWSNVANYDVAGILYDKNGNLKNLQRYRESGTLIDNLTYTYTAGKNRLASISDAVAATTETWDAESGSFTYNLNGAMLTAPAPYSITATTYDYRSLPISITRAGTTTQYRYSPDGQRYFKKTGTSAGEHYVLDGAVTTGLFTEAGALTYWNIIAAGSVIGRREASGAKRFYVKDHLGSTRMVVTDAGAVVETSDYYPFGLIMPGRGYVTGTPAKEKFTGKERDVESGLDYFGARYFMPAIGRWGVSDPLQDGYPGQTPYNYVLNNPIRFFDSTGLCPEGASHADVDASGATCYNEGNDEGVVIEASRTQPYSALGMTSLAGIGSGDDTTLPLELARIGYGMYGSSGTILAPDSRGKISVRNNRHWLKQVRTAGKVFTLVEVSGKLIVLVESEWGDIQHGDYTRTTRRLVGIGTGVASGIVVGGAVTGGLLILSGPVGWAGMGLAALAGTVVGTYAGDQGESLGLKMFDEITQE